MKFVILLERGEKNYSAYVPDLDGCVAAAETKEETLELMQEAIAEHIRLLKDSGQKAPIPRTESAVLEVVI